MIAKDVIVVGAAHLPGGAPKSRRNEKGYVRGFDVRTGKRLWIFHTIPAPGEFGNDTWEKDSWSYTGNAGVLGADERRRRARPGLPAGGDCRPATTTAAIGPGNGLFGESLVALDLKTGKRKWHYQFVHHGIWDWNLRARRSSPTSPSTARTIKALAQPTKQGWLYVFDRVTGSRSGRSRSARCEQADVPGE